MLKKMKKSAIVAGLLLSFVLPTFAWDEVGHKITAYIAWQQMRPDVRAKVIKTLLAAPEDAQLSTFYSAFGGGQTEGARQREFFMLIATWPDIIRDRNNFPVRFKNYAHADWHYADTFWRLKNGKVEPVTDAKPSGLAMDKLADFDKLIRSNATDARYGFERRRRSGRESVPPYAKGHAACTAGESSSSLGRDRSDLPAKCQGSCGGRLSLSDRRPDHEALPLRQAQGRTRRRQI
jgi:hypothetical protein